MRIALVSDCYLPRLGGIETQVAALAKMLRAQGHDARVITATPSGPQRGVQIRVEDGVPVTRITARMPADLPVNPWASRYLKAALAGADVVHIHTGVVSPFAWQAARICVAQQLPTAMTWHCLLAGVAAGYRTLLPTESWGETMALSAVSEVAAQEVARACHGQQVEVLPNGIDLVPWRQATQTARPQQEQQPELRAVTAMRLATRKRPLALVSALAACPAGRVSLDVFGAGPLANRLRRATKRAQVAVRLHGRVSAADLRQAYLQADLYLSPVHQEAFGIAALEARAAGLPVLGMAGSGVSEFITSGFDGLLVADDEEFAAGLATLTQDRTWLAELQQNARTNAPDFSWAALLPRYLAEYNRAREIVGC